MIYGSHRDGHLHGHYVIKYMGTGGELWCLGWYGAPTKVLQTTALHEVSRASRD